ncbi:class I SAM-dependent methyltransferase [Oscillospiraceae bacterium OttesenSCG-928-F05]|nr:class I SAM-dependent methyltransferase [Oscillospiraceae bacterium OttesenSCG-928-F05]
MWIAEGWKDYALLDCGGGERLERWKGIYLVRPDPQAIWPAVGEHPRWKTPDGRYERSSSGGGKWHRYTVPERWEISYGGLRFGIKTMNFKHTGIFPEQAANWDFIQKAVRSAERDVSVLNLFAYTGAATLAAAEAGASVCHVDAAKGMVGWGRENAALSGLSDKPVRWIVDDCVKFLQREKRRGKRYDAILMDPPSYGRGPGGEVWKLEDSLYELVTLAVDVLSDAPLFLLINSYTAGLAPSVLSYLMAQTVGRKYGGKTVCAELGLPCEATGSALPCGSAARWLSEELLEKTDDR